MYGKVNQYIADHQMELAQMVSDLIRIDSQNQGVANTANEAEAQEYVYNAMDALHLSPKALAYDEGKKRPNVYGIYPGTGGGKSLLINAHIDTVAITHPDEWVHPPLSGLIQDGVIYGRGASDDKMAVASMIFAIKALQECGVRLKGDVMLLSSVGEESGEGATVGAGPAVRDMPRPDFAIVSEATCMDMDIASSSYTCFEVTVRGKAAHTCARNQAFYPQRKGLPCGSEAGVDALSKALPIIQMLYHLERDWNLIRRYEIWGAGGTPVPDGKGVGAFAINPSLIKGGEYIGSIMSSVTILYALVYSSDIPLEQITKEVVDAIMAVASTDSWLREHPPEVKIPIIKDWRGFKTSMDEPGILALRNAFKETLGREMSITANKAVMDATFIQQAGIPVVSFGPGGPETNQHGVNEWASIKLLVEATQVYARMMMDWCGISD
mgnify:CR=1 FL=1